jgi:hypothetical protein
MVDVSMHDPRQEKAYLYIWAMSEHSFEVASCCMIQLLIAWFARMMFLRSCACLLRLIARLAITIPLQD